MKTVTPSIERIRRSAGIGLHLKPAGRMTKRRFFTWYNGKGHSLGLQKGGYYRKVGFQGVHASGLGFFLHGNRSLRSVAGGQREAGWKGEWSGWKGEKSFFCLGKEWGRRSK